ncbi:glutathione peroxidase [Kistimonas scapharcae]|uniref:Glutathione peroxidase n=1 Tax=Kistimonas scapharcae TaxID=1036133 RepID=A0ABP8UYC4_9GAMM
MDFLRYEIPLLNGKSQLLSAYSNHVILVVNTASKCGFTTQYQGLEALYQKYQDQGLVIIGFPCNQFGHQEPGNNDEIASFCEKNYGVSFPMFSKVDVNGENAHPLFKELKSAAPGVLGSEAIKWNFTKFLIYPDQSKVIRYSPTTAPEDLELDIRLALKKIKATSTA